MIKRLFYLSLSLLCLVSTYQLGADRARADWSGSGQIVGGCGSFAYDADGGVWNVSIGGGWQRWYSHYDLPVPTSEVKLITISAGGSGPGNRLVTTSDELWCHDSSEWHYIGPFPGGPVPLKTDSWGKVKDRYRD